MNPEFPSSQKNLEFPVGIHAKCRLLFKVSAPNPHPPWNLHGFIVNLYRDHARHPFLFTIPFKKTIKINTLTLAARVPPMNPEALNNNQTMNNANKIPPSKKYLIPLSLFMVKLSIRFSLKFLLKINQNQHIDPGSKSTPHEP